MFARASSVFVLALPVFAAASVLPRGGGGGGSPSNQCNTGSLHCCDSAVAPNDPTASLLLGLLGVVVGSVTGLVGLTCSPITIIGGATSSCSTQPVCCTGNNFNGGLLVLGCSPVNLSL